MGFNFRFSITYIRFHDNLMSLYCFKYCVLEKVTNTVSDMPVRSSLQKNVFQRDGYFAPNCTVKFEMGVAGFLS